MPAALQLYKNKEGEQRISPFLCDELSLFFDCGVSFAVLHEGQVIGILTNLLFERYDKMYSKHVDSTLFAWVIFRTEDNSNSEYITAKAWHDAAADIASEGSPSEMVHCWRHYQFLHLQHYGQNVTR